MSRTADVVVVGGGIIGGAIAWELAREKRSVVLLDVPAPGRSASWAAGGVLTPVHLAEYPGPLAALCVASQKLYEPWLKALAAPEVEYSVCGMLYLVLDDDGARDAAMLEAWKRERGQPAERLSAAAARQLESVVTSDLREALLLPDIAQLRNHRLTRAVVEAARREGAEVRRAEATGFLRVPGRINGVKTTEGDVFAGEVVLAAGAWSGLLAGSAGLKADVHPVRGQLILLAGPPGAVKRVVLHGDTYLIPRADGRILLGSTVEEAGFENAVTVDGVSGLLARGLRFAPGIRDFAIEATWAGLRPATPDRLPHLGRPESVKGLILATGHYRNGILLAPVTARIVADLVAGRPPSVDLSPFRPERFG